MAHPDEGLRRTSHALAVEGEVWLIDPLDAADVESVYGDLGDVVGVVVTFSHHIRDATTFAHRHDVPVYVPRWMKSVLPEDVPVEYFDDYLPGTGYRAIPVADQPLWKEVAFYDGPDAPEPSLDPTAEAGASGDPRESTLLVSESLGTAPRYVTGEEDLGVHPIRRPLPPKKTLGGLQPDRVLVGHGEGIEEGATPALRDALRNARRGIPDAFVKNVRSLLPG